MWSGSVLDISEKKQEETKSYLSLKQVATAVSMAPCDFCDPKTYFSVQKFQHCFKVQTRNKTTKKISSGVTANEYRKMELYRLQIHGYGEGLVKLNTQKKKKMGLDKEGF